MGDNFKKFKSEYFLSAILTSIVAGVSAAIISAAVLILSFKLAGIDFSPLYSSLIGVGFGGAAGVALFFIIRPNDKKTAKKLDGEYALDERVQTMVQYAGQSGAMVELQRLDAEEKLSEVRLKPAPKNKVYIGAFGYTHIARLVSYILVPVIAIGCMLGAVFAPSKVALGDGNEPENPNKPPVEEPVDEDKFVYDLYMIAAFSELVDSLRGSDLEDGLKESLIGELTSLDGVLQTLDKKSEMEATVLASVSRIDNILYSTMSFMQVKETVKKFDEELSTAIERGIGVFKASGLTFVKESVVKSYTMNLADSIEKDIEKHNYFKNSRQKVDSTRLSELEYLIELYLEKYNEAVKDIKTDGEDLLFNSFTEFAATLKGVYDIIYDGYNITYLRTAVDNAYAALNEKMVVALTTQVYHCIMNEFIRLNLADIFSIDREKLPELPYEITVFEDEGGGEDPGGSENPGGFGDGDKNFGSDDVIYDPAQEKWVKYSEVIDKYNSDILNDMLSGNVPEDLQDFINLYYEYLYSGFGENDK